MKKTQIWKCGKKLTKKVKTELDQDKEKASKKASKQ